MVFAPEKPTHCITEFIIPAAPSSAWETSHVISSTGIPWFGNNLAVMQYRIFRNSTRQKRNSKDIPIFATAKLAGQVKTETINMHLQNPVTQAVQNKLNNNRVICIYRISTACIIVVITSVQWRQYIVNLICKTAETKSISQMIAFCRMIVNDIKNHLNSSLMEFFYHLLEFFYTFPGISAA